MADLMPFNGMRYAHKGFRAEVEALEKAAAELGAATDEQLGQYAERVAFFRGVMKGHSEGEEEVLWPVLESKFPEVSVPYTLDHRAEEALFDSIQGLLARIRDARREQEQADLARQLSRQVTALNVTISHHSRKEDGHLVPLTEQHFSLAEQAEYSGKMVAHITRDQMPRVIPLVLRALTVEEREDFLRIMMGAMPPAAFQQGTARWVKAGLPTAEWEELARRIPELASAR